MSRLVFSRRSREEREEERRRAASRAAYRARLATEWATPPSVRPVERLNPLRAAIAGLLVLAQLLAAPAMAATDPAARGLAIQAKALATTNAGALSTNTANIATNAAAITAANAVSATLAQRQAFTQFYYPYVAARAAAKVQNPRTSGLYTGFSTAPTMSAAAPTAGSSPATVIFPSSSSSAASFSPYCAPMGGWTGYSAHYEFVFSVTKGLGQTATGGNSSVSNQTSAKIICYSTAATVTIKLLETQPTPVRVWVNGQLTSDAGYAFTGQNIDNYLTLSFGSRSSSGRRIEIELDGGNTYGQLSSNNILEFGGIYQAQNESLWAPTLGQLGMIEADSYGVGAGTTNNGNSFAADLRDLIGSDNFIISAIAGTGFIVRGSSGAAASLGDRGFIDVTGNAPRYLIVALGANEANYEGSTFNGVTVSTTTTQAQCQLQLGQIIAARPNMPIFVLGPWRFAGATQRNRVASYEAAIQACVTALQATTPLIAFIPVNTASPPWLTGTGNTTTAQYDGNGDTCYYSDNTHVVDACALMIAQRAADGLDDAVRKMAVSIGLTPIASGLDLPAWWKNGAINPDYLDRERVPA